MIALDKLLDKLEIDTESNEWKIEKSKIMLGIMIMELIKEIRDKEAYDDIYNNYKDLNMDKLEEMDIHELVCILFDLFMNM